MKIAFLPFLMLILHFSCKRYPFNETLIKGKISGEIPEEIVYSVPLNGICYDWFNDTVHVDKTGYFEFKIRTDKPCFISLFLEGNRVQLVAEPAKTYELVIESKDFENNVKYNCYNAEVQMAYQSLESPVHPQLAAMQFWKILIVDVQHNVDSLRETEIKIFSEFLDKNTLSKELYDLIVFDRNLYYNSVLGQVATLKYVELIRQNQEGNRDSIKKFWEDAISGISLDSGNMLKSKWAYYFIQNYLLFCEYMDNGYSSDIRKKVRQEERIHSYLLDISKKYLSGEVLEFYNASYLLSSAHQKKFERELIELFDDFKNEFPDSKYISFLKPQIEKVVDFHNKAEKDYDEGVKFLSNYETLNSLDECLKPLKGKKIYVDIWVTSCGPCKKEFAFNTGLKSFLKSTNTEVLYISTDRDEEGKRWKEMIKYYRLTGNHVRANNELKEDLRRILGRYGIPRYIFIDEKGNIVNDDAPRPSDPMELKKLLIE